jgi:hypothetical protein
MYTKRAENRRRYYRIETALARLFTPWLVLVLTLGCAALQAQTISIPLGIQGDSSIAVPAGGSSMQEVRERFGAARMEHPAVGVPPITRWDYPAFSVFFEGDRVISAVRRHQPRYPAERP